MFWLFNLIRNQDTSSEADDLLLLIPNNHLLWKFTTMPTHPERNAPILLGVPYVICGRLLRFVPGIYFPQSIADAETKGGVSSQMKIQGSKPKWVHYQSITHLLLKLAPFIVDGCSSQKLNEIAMIWKPMLQFLQNLISTLQNSIFATWALPISSSKYFYEIFFLGRDATVAGQL